MLIIFLMTLIRITYDSLVESVLSRETPLSIQDLYTRLMSNEQRIERRHATNLTGHSVNLARSGSRNA